jgi:hypothetical protein
MKQTIMVGDFRDAFIHAGRKENFSYEGLGYLYDYLEELDPEYDLDVIALCCEYGEGEIEEVLKDYGLADLEELNEKTHVVAVFGGRVLYAQF